MTIVYISNIFWVSISTIKKLRTFQQETVETISNSELYKRSLIHGNK